MQRYARVLDPNPIGYLSSGETFAIASGLEWQSIEWLNPWDCEHVETMCSFCVESWNCDYDIELPEGIDE